jgi:uncharacterized membrane protein
LGENPLTFGYSTWSIVAFAIERDLVYVLITSTVLVVLLTSFVLGRVE